MNTLNVSFPLGRLALTHESRKGMHLVQDQVSRHWLVVPSDRPTTLREKLARLNTSLTVTLTAFKPGKKSVFAMAAIVGLVFAITLNQFALPSSKAILTPVAATVPIAAAPVVPAAINVNTAPYVESAPAPSGFLPPPMPVPVATNVPSMPEPAQLRAPVVAQKPAPGRPAADDSSMAVFNEPLQLAAPSQRLTMPPSTRPGQELVTQGIPSSPLANKNSANIKVRILAVQSPTTIVVTNPATRLPMLVKVGDPLPDGSVLKSIDKATSSAVNSRGEALVLQ